MKVAIGSDHGGFPAKAPLVKLIQSLGHEVIDVGAYADDPLDDYPDFAEKVARKIQSGEADRGIVLCGSGVGASIAANKVKGVRAGLCHDTYSAAQGVEHDAMNVLCIGSRVVGIAVANELVKAFLGAQYSGETRHERRLNKVLAIEKNG